MGGLAARDANTGLVEGAGTAVYARDANSDLRTLDGLRILEELPDDAAYGTIDESTGSVYPYAANGTALGVVVENGNGATNMAGYNGGQDNSTVPTALAPRAAQARGCTALDSRTVQTIACFFITSTRQDPCPVPGWKRLSGIADSQISNRARNIGTNEGPDLPATICITTKPIDIAVNGKPKCSENTQSIQGHFNGTSGSVELSVTTGTDYRIESTTTRTTTFGLSVTYGATFGIPEVASVGASTTISSEFRTAMGRRDTAGTNLHQVTSKVNANHADGQRCKVDLNTKTCTTHGSANIPFIARGVVWFNYHDRVKGHYKWWYRMEEILSEDERSLFAQVESVLASETKAAYGVVCTK
ncbi:hypothetical protein K525DRAFT_264549 [Schizophyllum commune Loenen D]|nr:hypothetical protein K525DRAFT_264549 [Schizophyllum commune Loenen D]